jgi:hypothetical protein
MHVGSLLEMFTTVYGWKLYEIFFEILCQTGIIFIPFGVMIYRNVREPYTSQHSKSASATSLVNMTWDTITMIVVILLAAIPIVPLNIGSLDFSYSCDGAVQSSTNPTETTYADGKIYSNDNVKLPVIWYLAIATSSGINYAIIKNLPCFTDFPELDQQLRNITIRDEPLRAEFGRFANECFIPAKTKFLQAMNGQDLAMYEYVKNSYESWQGSANVSKTVPDVVDPFYVGSRYYLGTPGFYTKNIVHPPESKDGGFSLRAAKPVAGWPFDANRDTDYTQQDIDKALAGEVGGKPQCDEWWTGAGNIKGLRLRIAETSEDFEKRANPQGIWERVKAWLGPSYSQADLEDLMIQRLVENHSRGHDFSGTTTPVVTKYGEGVLGTAAAVAVGVGAVAGAKFVAIGAAAGGAVAASALAPVYTRLHMIKQGAPMVQAILLCFLYLMIPALIVASCFNPKVITTGVLLIMGVRFCTVLWEIGKFLDTELYQAMYPDVWMIGSAMTLDYKRLILDIVLGSFFMVSPLMLVLVMGTAGYKFNGLGNMFSDGVSDATKAGESGAKSAVGVAGRSIGKGGGKS